MKSAIKLLLSTTALTGGLLFSSINEATACSHFKNIGTTDATNLPSLNLDQLDWKKVGAFAATSIAAVTAGVLSARQGEQKKQATEATQEDVFQVSSFPIPVVIEAVSPTETETVDDDQLTPIG